jgi:hypothetical protein
MTKTVVMTEPHIKKLIEETVRTTLLNIGFNVADGEDMLKHQQDMHWVRTQRERGQTLVTGAWRRGMEIVLTAIIGAILLKVAGYHPN